MINQSIQQQLSSCQNLMHQLIQQTQQASGMYEQLLQQEQQNAHMLQQLAQKEQLAAQNIQTALRGHQTAIQQMQQVSHICGQIEDTLTQTMISNQAAYGSTVTGAYPGQYRQ
jgi:hypothetical protein